jgi:hypothetical protein
MWRRPVLYKFADVSEQGMVSIFRFFLLRASYWLLAWIFLRLWRWKQYVLPKYWWNPTGLHGVTPQKIVLFIVCAVRPLDPAKKFNHRIHTELPNQLETPCSKNVRQAIAHGPIYGGDRRKYGMNRTRPHGPVPDRVVMTFRDVAQSATP